MMPDYLLTNLLVTTSAAMAILRLHETENTEIDEFRRMLLSCASGHRRKEGDDLRDRDTVGEGNGDELEKLVCVTSGVSYLGIAVVSQLLVHGYSMRIIVDNAEEDVEKLREREIFGEMRLTNGIIEIVLAKLTEIESLANAFDGFRGVFHTAGFIDPARLSCYSENFDTKSLTPCIATAAGSGSGSGCNSSTHSKSTSPSSPSKTVSTKDLGGDSKTKESSIEGDNKEGGNRPEVEPWRSKEIPIFEMSDNGSAMQIGEMTLLESFGYYTFSLALVAAGSYWNVGIEDTVPTALWPWLNHDVYYNTNGLISMNPIETQWQDFCSRLHSILVVNMHEYSEQKNLLPVTLHPLSGEVVQTNLDKEFVTGYNSFRSVVHFIWSGWKKKEPDYHSALIMIGEDKIQFYAKDGRELFFPWEEDRESQEEDGEDGESQYMEDDGESQGEEDGEDGESQDMEEDEESQEEEDGEGQDMEEDEESQEEEDEENQEENEIQLTFGEHEFENFFQNILASIVITEQNINATSPSTL